MPLQQIVLYGVLGMLTLSLVGNWLRPSAAFLLAAVLLLFTGVLQPAQLLVGLANKQIAIIILLVLISASLRQNYDIKSLFDWLFARAKSTRSFLALMMSSVAACSAFINNTPMVAMMTPYVYEWGQQRGVSPSKLLIPLSFATMLGGMITVVGTSTNLVINGFLAENKQPLLQYTDFLFLGLIVTVVGILFLLLLGPMLLPDRRDQMSVFKERSPEYVVEAKLEEGCPLSGKTVKEAQLRRLNGLFLVDIIRGDKVVSPVGPEEVLQVNDKLLFAGDTEKIFDLVKDNQGLGLPKPNGTFVDNKVRVTEAIVPANSSLVGQYVRESDFRNRFDAAILAIHRNGERIRGQIGGVRLQMGDLLLLTIGHRFYQHEHLKRDLFVISKVTPLERSSPRNRRIFLWLLLGAVALVIVGAVELFLALVLIFTAMLLLGLASVGDIKRDLDFDLIAILVCALAIGNALISTGAADVLSQALLAVVEPFGQWGLLVGIFLLTLLITSFVTNAAAVSISFPLAYALSLEMGVSGTPYYVAIAFAASAAFMTPVGYQTNLMVYGPGGYNFGDYFRIGLPLALLHGAVCLTFIAIWYF